MTTKNKQTFASRAKSIQKKYPRRETDKIEQQDFEDEMDSLISEQEQYRAANGMGQENSEQTQQFDGGGWLENKINEYKQRQRTPIVESNVEQLNVRNSPVPASQLPFRQEVSNYSVPQTISNMAPFQVDPNYKEPINIPEGKKIIKKFNPTTTQSSGSVKKSPSVDSSIDLNEYLNNATNALKWEAPSAQMNIPAFEAPASSMNSMRNISGGKPIELTDTTKSAVASQVAPSGDSSLVPSYVAAGAGILGNVLQSALARKPKQIQAPSYSPKELDLYDRVLQAKRSAEEASAASGVRSRNLGLNAGATIANQSATQSEIDKNLGNQLTDISVAQGQYNVGEANKAGMINAENRFKTDVLNEQMKQQFADRQLEGLTGALGVIPDAMQDINKIKAQDKLNKRLSSKDLANIELLKSLYGNYSDLGFNPYGDVTSVKYKGK